MRQFKSRCDGEKLTQLDEPHQYIDSHHNGLEKNKRLLARLHGGIRFVTSFLGTLVYSFLGVTSEHGVN